MKVMGLDEPAVVWVTCNAHDVVAHSDSEQHFISSLNSSANHLCSCRRCCEAVMLIYSLPEMPKKHMENLRVKNILLIC